MDAITPQVSFKRIAISYPVRLAIYAVVSFVVFQIIVDMVDSHGAAVMGAENGPLETAQVYLAVFTAICLFWAAAMTRAGRAGLIGCAAMVSYAAAREADVIFETLMFEDAYKYVVGLPMAAIVLVAFWTYRKKLVSESLWLVRQPAVTMFAIAGIYLCAMCQILDRPRVWAGVQTSTETEMLSLIATKAFVEETAELFAYILLAFSGIEAIVLAWLLRKKAAAAMDMADTVPFLQEATSEQTKSSAA